MVALRVALAFLTRFPVRLPADLPPERLAASSAFFPLAGWLLGGLQVLLAWGLLGLGATPLLAATVVVGFGAWLTRGLHLDGLADLCDGLGGSFEPGKRLAIMKDSATGAFGVIGLILLLLAKVAALAALLDGALGMASCGWPILQVSRLTGLVAAPVAARWGMAALACGSTYPRAVGTGHAFVGRVRLWHLLGGAFFLLPLLAMDLRVALVAILAVQLPALGLRVQCDRALGGVTGDVLGAACELGEAAGWIAVVLWIGRVI